MVYHSKALHKQYMFIYLLQNKFESNHAMIVISLTSVTYIIYSQAWTITRTIITFLGSSLRKIPSKLIFISTEEVYKMVSNQIQIFF